MSIRDASEYLNLVTDFPGAESVNWNLNELYQRDVNWPRVESEIKPYLMDEHNPQFFNALTVALLPLTDGGNFRQSFQDFEEGRFDPPGITNPSITNPLNVGPISLGYWGEWDSFDDSEAQIGQLRWNPDQVFSVAIDGQHRLAGLRLLVKSGQVFPQHLTDTKVPVILLVFDERLGFKAPADVSQVDIMRRLFVDLNKNAKPVNRARSILLDDLDPVSRCTRALIGSQLSNNLDELKESILSLSLVDWHSEHAKIDEGPYLSTILGLEWIISKVLGIKAIDDWTAYGRVSRQINQISTSTGADLSEARARLADLRDGTRRNDVRPFRYLALPGNDELQIIEDAFRERWAPTLIEVLTQFTPYAALIEMRTAQQSFSIELSNWLAAHQKNETEGGTRAKQEFSDLTQRLLQNTTLTHTLKDLYDILNDINQYKKGNLAFTVAFQRAYILAMLLFLRIDIDSLIEQDDFAEYDIDSESDAEEEDEGVSDPNSDQNTQTLTQSQIFLKSMNRLNEVINDVWTIDKRFDDDGSPKRFWLGTLQRPESEKNIDFTQAGSGRTSNLLMCMTAIVTAVTSEETGRFRDYEALLAKFRSDSEGSTKSIGARFLSAFSSLSRDENSTGGRILGTMDVPFTIEKSQQEIHSRLKYIFDAVS
jgi:hypothetical protein